ncbi:nuclear transport factor 2 family protein [Nocardia sp. NPDC020380]|uniref:nuclear transport factor 2 family protein n=1 Tax=Nocardia sp. NPDC020380 TaxID=3364309 RepID=UPI0037B91D5E
MLDQHIRNGTPVTFGELYAEVMQFYAEHMHLLDSGAATEWAETFCADGTFDVPTLPAPVQGRAALAAAIRHAAEQQAKAGEVHRHWHGMVAITPHDDGTLAVRCYALVFATARGGDTRLHRACVCEDVLTRTEGALRVRSRRVTRDDGFTLPS